MAISPPIVRSTSTSTDSGAGTHTVDYPGTMVAGDLVLCTFAVDSDDETPVFPTTGDNIFVELYENGANGVTLVVAYHIVTGNEGATFDVTGLGNEASAHACYCIQNPNASIVPEVSSGASGTSATPDPDSITAGEAGGANMFVACCAIDRRTISGYPSNCPDSNITGPSSGSGGATAGMASDQLTQDTFDPGTFACANDGWVAVTVVVYGDLARKLANTGTPIADGDGLTSGKDSPSALVKLEFVALGYDDTDQITPADVVIVPAGETKYLTANLSDNDSVNTPALDATHDLAAGLDDDDTLNVPLLDLTWDLSSSLDDDDTVTQAKLDGLKKLAADLDDDDSITAADLSSATVLKLTASLTDTDTWTAPALDLTWDLSSSLTDDDALAPAKLDGLKKLVASLTDTDTITTADLAIVGAVVTLSATLTDADAITDAEVYGRSYLDATLPDTDTLSLAGLDALVELVAGLDDDDVITGAALVGPTQLTASLTDTDAVTTATLAGPTKMSASIQEWPEGVGGGAYATGVIIA